MQQLNRIANPSSIDRNLIEAELKSGKKVVIQFGDKSYSDKILSEINNLCFKYDENLCIRFYGHYSDYFDCRTVLEIPNVKCLYVDCLQTANNIYALTELLNLKRLNLDILDLKETEILSSNNFKNLNELLIGSTKTKALNLDYLRYYNLLRSLTIIGHTKGIEAVGELTELKELFLNSIKQVPIPFVNRLKKLKTLGFLLGGRNNIQEIEENEIENLEIVWVRGFNDVSNISKFKKLKTLKIEDEIQLSKVNFENEFQYLTDLKILNCKILNSIKGLKNLPQLNSLVIYKTNIDFADFMQQELPKRLKTLGFYTTKSKIDATIKATLENQGYFCL